MLNILLSLIFFLGLGLSEAGEASNSTSRDGKSKIFLHTVKLSYNDNGYNDNGYNDNGYKNEGYTITVIR
jgi:hypothetical protein